MESFEALSALMKYLIEIGPTGCACMITKHEEPVYVEYVGYANRESTKPITPDTIYRVYSMTKVITVTAALMLYERGMYLLNDPLEVYMPEFSDMQVCTYDATGVLSIRTAKNPILIRDLFCMTSGLTYDGDACETERRTKEYYKTLRSNNYTAREAMRELARVPLVFEPGTHWKYGLSHDALGALIEALTGKRLSQFMKDEIFDPLGMKDSFFHIPEDRKTRLCGIYTRNTDGTYSDYLGCGHEFNDINDRYDNGGGGVMCTLADYTAFATALACGGEKDGVRLLGKKTIELMATNHLGQEQLRDFRNTPQRAGYGYGLGVRTLMDRASSGSNSSIGEFGWGGLAGTWMMVDPKEEAAAVFMQQLWPSMSEYIQPRLRAAINAAL